MMSTCCGVRGSLSLTAALSIPLVTDSHAPFPGRDAIVALSAGTILATLLVNSIAALAVGAGGRAGSRPAPDVHSRSALAANSANASLPLALAVVRIDPVNEPAIGKGLLRSSSIEGTSPAQVIEFSRRSLDRLARPRRISEECRRDCEAELDLAELAAKVHSQRGEL